MHAESCSLNLTISRADFLIVIRRPQASWLRQTEAYLKDTGMTGLASAWRLPGRWPDGGVSERYGHGGPGVCLDDGQTAAEEVLSQGGRGDALSDVCPHT